MLLNVFNLILSFAVGPIYEIQIVNTNSTYDFTYNEITLNFTTTLSNTVTYTQDTLYGSINVNLGDYISSYEIGKLIFRGQVGNYYVDNDYFEMNLFYMIDIYDLDYALYDGIMGDLTFTGTLAEGLIVEYENLEYSVDFTYLLYDFKDTYDKGYEEGREDGLEIGYNEGYEEGREDGLEQGRNEGQGINNVISWFGSIWDGLARILALEIAPNLTIGTIITIPIVIAVLFFGLKALIQ